MLRNVILLVENCYGSKILKKDSVLSTMGTGTNEETSKLSN